MTRRENLVQPKELMRDLVKAGNLDRAFRMLDGLQFPLALMDVVAQDEFSHDVCLPFPSGKHVLVIGAT